VRAWSTEHGAWSKEHGACQEHGARSMEHARSNATGPAKREGKEHVAENMKI
jgi:hypothetical protein